MSKIRIKHRAEKHIVINKLSYPEALNDHVYKIIVSKMAKDILPVSVYEKGKDVRLECSVQGLVPLVEYLQGPVTKSVFFRVIKQVIACVRVCEKLQINPNNLDLKTDMVFVDQESERMKYIYWPLVNNQRGAPVEQFFKHFPDKLVFDHRDGAEYINTYRAFFSDLVPFSIGNFEKMVLELSDEQGASSNARLLIEQVQRNMESKKTSNVEFDPLAFMQRQHEDAPTRNEQIPDPGNVMCTFCGKINRCSAVFCAYCGSTIETQAEIIAEEPDVEGTVDFGITGRKHEMIAHNQISKEPTFPKLRRLKTGEEYSIDRAIVRIGTEVASCDLYISDNAYISRSHANIVSRNGEHFIVDTNSTNHSYVNGKMIQKDQEIRLTHGDKIRLANENFEFEFTDRRRY